MNAEEKTYCEKALEDVPVKLREARKALEGREWGVVEALIKALLSMSKELSRIVIKYVTPYSIDLPEGNGGLIIRCSNLASNIEDRCADLVRMKREMMVSKLQKGQEKA